MIDIMFINLRGALCFTLYLVNTLFWAIPICFTALLKRLIPIKYFHKFFDIILNGCANNWILANNMNQRLFCKIRWHVFGMDSLKNNGWYLVVSNHQTWVDILVLQNIFYHKIPFLKFFLKKELFKVPVIGQAWWALDFPFMERYSRDFLEKNPHLKGRDLEITKKACEKFKTIPVSVMNFVEGTRFTRKKHEKQQSSFKNLLKPRAGGIAFALNAMGDYLQSFVDVTIAYPQGAKSFWDFLCGRVTEIRVYVKAIPVTPEMLGNYFEDDVFRIAFQKWVNNLWLAKDKCIDELLAAPVPDPALITAKVPCFPELSVSDSAKIME
ncbi:acyltransferase [Desulfobacterales bacterium HSG16]|nr:acyltransferase [Desulfobacterales bacterium HSG16]